MLAIERRTEILEKLQKEHKVVVGELSRCYAVSEETIRRDLEKLEQDGYAVKSYGGAVLNEQANKDLPFNIRKKRNVPGKQKIAELLCDLVSDGERLMLDASSTAVFIAKKLKEKKSKLTLITNSVEILVELFDVSDWQIISSGGTAREGTLALTGAQTDRMLSSYCVDKAIISCKGAHLTAGMTDSDEMHAKNKKTMLESARERILVADHTKFGEKAFVKIADLSEFTMIVTDKKPDEMWQEALKNLGITCVYPESGE